MAYGYDEVTGRTERVVEFKIGGGVRTKRMRIFSAITIDDLMMNAVRAEAMRIKTGACEPPSFGPKITDYLLKG